MVAVTDPAWLDGGRMLPLVEDFYTIQGEGFHAGKPAYFIRLGGCDVGGGCHRRGGAHDHSRGVGHGVVGFGCLAHHDSRPVGSGCGIDTGLRVGHYHGGGVGGVEDVFARSDIIVATRSGGLPEIIEHVLLTPIARGWP